MKLLLIIALVLSLHAKKSGKECNSLLRKAINDLNIANFAKRRDNVLAYTNRSLANAKMFELCIEIDEDYNIDKIRKELWRIK